MYCTVNDVKIHYQVLPKDGAPTLLLMHGAGTRLNILKPLATKLSKYNRVLIDLPGHGKSAGRPLGSVAEYADFIEEFVRTLKLKDIYLVGYSMGGFIAIELAIRKKTPLKGLVMVDTTPQMEKNLEDSFKEQIRRDEFDEFHFLSYGGIWNWNVFRIVVTSLFYSLTHKPVMLADFQNCVLRFDRRQEIDQIQLPALIITGEKDPIAPPVDAEFCRNRISGAEKEIFPRYGHFLPVAIPKAVARRIEKFIK